MANNITRWDNESAPNLLLAIDPGAADKKASKKGDSFPYAGCALFQWGQLVLAKTIVCPKNTLQVPVRMMGKKSAPEVDPSSMEEKPKSVRVMPFSRPNVLVRTVCAEMGVVRHGGGSYVVKKGDKWGMGGDGGGSYCPKCSRGGRFDLGEALTVLAVENQYYDKRQAVRAKDILALKAVYGAFMGGIDADFYSGPVPSEWKGSLDGKQLHERVLEVLGAHERTVLMMGQHAGHDSMSEHSLDAVGLGLFVLARAGVAMVI